MCQDSPTVIETSLGKKVQLDLSCSAEQLSTIRKVQGGNWLQNVQHAFFGFPLWLRLQISTQPSQATELPHHGRGGTLQLQHSCCNVFLILYSIQGIIIQLDLKV